MTTYLLSALAERLGGELRGADVSISHVASLESAGQGALAFLGNPRFKAQLAASAAEAVVLKAADAEALARPHVIAKDPHLFFCPCCAVVASRACRAAGYRCCCHDQPGRPC